MQILIKNGRLLDPESGTDKVTDILIEDGKVTDIGEGLKLPAPKKRKTGKVVGAGDDMMARAVMVKMLSINNLILTFASYRIT